MRKVVAQLAGAVLVLGLGLPALGKVAMRIEVGWDGMYRVGKWTPVYITASDDQITTARPVVLDILAPHDNMFALRLRQVWTLRPDPTTFLLYVPLTWQLDESVVVVRDLKTGRKLAERSLDPSGNIGTGQRGWSGSEGAEHILMGASGRRGAIGILNGQFSWTEGAAVQQNSYPPAPRIKTGHLPQQLLPDAMQGYEGLDVLVLFAPDLVSMRPEQQEAIVAWVRGGGRLVMYPGEGTMPPDSAIAKILPCTVGESAVVALTLDDCKKLGVPSRVEKIASRQLEALAGAKRIPILLGKGEAICRRVGLGEVAVLSADVSPLPFEQQDRALNFWRPILKQLIKPPDLPANSGGYDYYVSREEGRRLMAMQTVVDRLGDVPGVGTFDFTYIAIVMLAMMFVVGPVDWFVLKKLKQQPWTWATTTGWIVLITTGALYIGYMFRSGDLYYRTVRLVDQADGQVASALDVVGIYSPRTQAYDLDGPRDSWWEPANIDAPLPWRRTQRIPTEVPMAQDTHGTRPLGMFISVWNLRFMQGEMGDPASVNPVFKADLRRKASASSGGGNIVGSLTNLSASPLSKVYVRTKDGTAVVNQVIDPGQTVQIDVQLLRGDVGVQPPQNVQYNPWGPSNSPYSGPTGFLQATCDLASGRTDRIERLMKENENMACIYAESDDAPPAVKLMHKNRKPAIEKHCQVIRALVELKQVDDGR